MIKAIKNGKKVRRECWSGDKFLYYVPSASYPARTGIENSIADKDGKVLYKEYIAIRCKDGDAGDLLDETGTDGEPLIKNIKILKKL